MARARAACEFASFAGFESAIAVQVPDGSHQGIVCAATGRVEPVLDIARGLARRVVGTGRPLQILDTQDRFALGSRRHAAVPIGRANGMTFVLVVSDPRLTQREGQALATWAAPAHAEGMRTNGGSCAPLVRELFAEFVADAIVVALFAQSGLLLNLHVRSGGLLHSWRVPTDTVWGEVARHGAAFTLGDLPVHPGAELLASVGMRVAALVGLENGNGVAIGALGVATGGVLDPDVAHMLLARAPGLGPDLMGRLSSTTVPVPDEDGTIDLQLLAARIGCRRFAMYERAGAQLRLVAAHARDGSRTSPAPDELEVQLVCTAAAEGVGVVNDEAAAVLIGEHTVLYAQDPRKRALDCLRRALQDVRRNPFEADRRDAA